MMDRSTDDQEISRHFHLKAKIVIWSILTVTMISLLVAYLVPRVREFVAVDRCLDAGGLYNHQAKTCEGCAL
jgi:hypothetical protein